MTLLPTTETSTRITVPPTRTGEQHPRRPLGQNFDDVINNMPRPAEKQRQGETPKEQEKTTVDEPISPPDHDEVPVLASESKPDSDQELIAVRTTGQTEDNPSNTPRSARPRDIAEYALASHPQFAPNNQTRSASDLPLGEISVAKSVNNPIAGQRIATPNQAASAPMAPRPAFGREIFGDGQAVSISNSGVAPQPSPSPDIPPEFVSRAPMAQLIPPRPEQGPTEVGLRMGPPPGTETTIGLRTDGMPNPGNGTRIALSDSTRPSEAPVRAISSPPDAAKDAVFKTPQSPAPVSNPPSIIERSNLGQMMNMPAIAKSNATPKTEREDTRSFLISDAALPIQTKVQTSVSNPAARRPIPPPDMPIGISANFKAEDVGPFPDDEREGFLNSLSLKDTLGVAGSVTVSGSSVAVGTDVPRADMARSVGAQLAEQMTRRPQGSVDITLNPEELGRVRMAVNASETTVAVSIVAERPETLDLMRRHVDQLIEEFRQLGYDGVEFEFSDNAGTSDRSQDSPTSDTFLAGSEISDEGAETADKTSNRAGQQTGLDMRL